MGPMEISIGHGSDASTNRNCKTNCDSNSNCNPKRNTNGNCDGKTDCNANCNGNTNCNSGSDSNAINYAKTKHHAKFWLVAKTRRCGLLA